LHSPAGLHSSARRLRRSLGQPRATRDARVGTVRVIPVTPGARDHRPAPAARTPMRTPRVWLVRSGRKDAGLASRTGAGYPELTVTCPGMATVITPIHMH